MKYFLFSCLIVGSFLGAQLQTHSQTIERPTTLAVLKFGDSTTGRLAAARLSSSLKEEKSLALIDRDLAVAAARGAGYENSFNLSLAEARDLGAAIGSDFFMLGDAQTIRRSPSKGPAYFESYASIFLVSARSGKLIRWDRPKVRGASAEAAEKDLLTELSSIQLRREIAASIRRAFDDERNEREATIVSQAPLIEEAPDDDKQAEAQGLRLPRPFRRLVPAYPQAAADAEAEATVDVLVDLDARGEVTRVEVERWAGFGLDQSTVETVRKLQFFPAMRDGVAIPIRVLLRYNFRKPPR